MRAALRISQLLALLARGALIVSGVALVAMTVVVGWAVFGRFVLNDTPAWAEASALLLLGWVIMGAAAIGVREGFHMGFDTVQGLLPGPVRRLFAVLSDLVVTLFGVALAWFSTELAGAVWNATLPTVGLPGTVEYLPHALGGALMAIFGAERLMGHFIAGHVPAGLPEQTILTDA